MSPAAQSGVGFVVLCGAGVSVAPPSSVPSWWGFNQAVLTELRSRFLEERTPPKRAVNAMNRLSLDDLDVTEFSQLVSDAFAGATWFDVLGVLDGVAPNMNHLALAYWAKEGSLRAVVTTNFDTLIERAMHEAGVRHRVYDAQLDDVPRVAASGTAIVKVHGSAPRRSSLVDLAAQKRRGLPVAWLDWLEAIFATNNVAVAGFSGADLALGDDYFRLKAASGRTPSLLWLNRPGNRPSDGASEVVRLLGSRGGFVDGTLPDAWSSLGAPLEVATGSASPQPDDSKADVAAAISGWLDNPMVDADTCGLALSRLLDSAGKVSASQALRTSILTRVRRRLRAGLNVAGALRAAHQIGQLAGDEPPARAEQAIYCLGLASRALDAVLEHLPEESLAMEDVMLEVAHDRATILCNIGYFEVLRGRLPAAASAIMDASRQTQLLDGVLRMDHDSSELEVTGAIAYLRGDHDLARLFWHRSHDLATRVGNARRMKTTSANLHRLNLGIPLRVPLAGSELLGGRTATRTGVGPPPEIASGLSW